MKILLMLLIMVAELSAINQNGLLVGKWQTISQTNNQGTLTIEKESMYLNANTTFSLLLLVSVEKGEAFVRDLQIKVTGIWKVHKDTLVYVIKTIDVPLAKEVYRISQKSLEQLANHFRHRFDNQPIRILRIQTRNTQQLNVINEEGKVSRYTR